MYACNIGEDKQTCDVLNTRSKPFYIYYVFSFCIETGVGNKLCVCVCERERERVRDREMKERETDR